MSSGVAFDAATVLLEWAVGGLAFFWVTARRREVGLGYGWLLRSIFAAIALGAGLAALRWPYQADSGNAASIVAIITAAAVLLLTAWALVKSVTMKSVTVKSAAAPTPAADPPVPPVPPTPAADPPVPPVPPVTPTPAADIWAPLAGAIGLVVLALSQGIADEAGIGATALHATRLLVGAAFLGVLTDAMLLGHWYLVQPGLRREPLLELVAWLRRLWPLEIAVLIVPVGMVSVFSGTIDDGYGGLLGWFWAACAITTIALAEVAKRALAERQYSAVMAATGLLYLAILSGFGTDLVARLVLAA